ncbi:MAG TPA: BamA/TamA family outer membrane protein [Gemmatimonadales bacterium]|jgi:hypothetical protein
MHRRVPRIITAAILAVPATAAAQQTATLVTSSEYDITRGWYPILGHNWRDVWIATITAPVLDVGTFDGGLTPFRSGGNHTATLWFHGADGRTFVFHETVKSEGDGIEPDLMHGVAGVVVRDEPSVYHPAATLVTARLEAAAGLLTTPSTLMVMPNDARLDSFRLRFAGKLGTIEERPEEGHDDRPGSFGADAIKSTETVAKDLDRTLRDRIDSRGYLAARLVDAMIGDADRGCDQWRWAEFAHGSSTIFVPISRDHDHAFARPGGLRGSLIRAAYPKEENFSAKSPPLAGVAFETSNFDRSQLVDLDWATWDSVTAAIQRAWTDAVIDSAANAMPAEWIAATGGLIAAGLKSRRDHLRNFAWQYFLMVNTDADLFASDESDRAIVDRLPDGSVTVRLEAAPAKGSNGQRTVAMIRRFVPSQTSEIRLYMEDGDDTVLVRGAAKKSITVRVIGGHGDDVLDDSSTGNGATIFYDAGGHDQVGVTSHTTVRRRAFTLTDPDTARDSKDSSDDAAASDDATASEDSVVHLDERRGRFSDLVGGSCIVVKNELEGDHDRNWGRTMSFHPVAEIHGNYGLAIGAAWTTTSYSFRHFPYRSALTLSALGTPLYGGAAGAKASFDLRAENSSVAWIIAAQATQLHSDRFFGFGNVSPTISTTTAWIPRDEVTLEPSIRWYLDPRSWISAGAIVGYRSLTPQPGSPADSLGVARHDGSSAGVRLRLAVDHRDNIQIPRSGFTLGATTTWYPRVWDIPEYGRADWYASTYLSAGSPTLALRVGGARVFGDQFPLYDAALIGGRTSIRGLTWDRYAGDASLQGSAELRLPLMHVTLLDGGMLGIIGFEDAGRVWYRGASPGGWHRGTGGGFSFTTLGAVGTLVYAYGDGSHVYVSWGFPF